MLLLSQNISSGNPFSFRERRSHHSGLQVLHSVFIHLVSALSIIPAASAHWSARSSSNLPDNPLPQSPRCCLCREHPDVYSPALCKLTCSVRFFFLHSPIENCIFVPRHSTHLPALFLSIAPTTISHALGINLLCSLSHTLYYIHCMRTSLRLFRLHSITNAKNTAWHIVSAQCILLELMNKGMNE